MKMTTRQLIALTKWANTLLARHDRGHRSERRQKGLSDRCLHRDCERRRVAIRVIDADTRAFLDAPGRTMTR